MTDFDLLVNRCLSVQYVTVEDDGHPEESVILALDLAGLWILLTDSHELESIDELPSLTKSNQQKFSELPSRVQYQLISDLPAIVKFFADEMKHREEQAQEILEKLEKIVEDFNSKEDNQ